MAIEIRVPTLGESVTEATIGKWFKKLGEAVKKDEPLVELETDKVTLEVNAPEAGILAEITAKDGDTVNPNALLGQITAQAAGATAAPSAPPPAPTQAMPPAPAAAKIAADRGLNVTDIAGSGRRGGVWRGAFRAAPAAPAPVSAPI